MSAEELLKYMSNAESRTLPESVIERAGLHILDTVAAIVTGARLPAGEAATVHLTRNHAEGPSHAIGTARQHSPELAALANGMAAHANETDDSHEPSRTHPGCAIFPAALAVAQQRGSSGTELLRAMTLGYDVAGRLTPAMWPDYVMMRTRLNSSHAIGGVFGAAAACGSLAGLDAEHFGHLLSYAGQEASGIMTWLRDVEHIEKAYVFAGMPASSGVRCLGFVESGWPGVRNVFEGEPNFFQAFGVDSDIAILSRGIGARYIVEETNIKRFSVGSPIQAPLQGVVDLMALHGVSGDDVKRLHVDMPKSLADLVIVRDMPDICLSYLLEVAIRDGDVTFVSSHDHERFGRWQKGHRAVAAQITINSNPEMEPIRQAIVTLNLIDGSELRSHERAVRGTAQNPMTADEVTAKATALLETVYSPSQTNEIVMTLTSLDEVDDCRVLSNLLASQ